MSARKQHWSPFLDSRRRETKTPTSLVGIVYWYIGRELIVPATDGSSRPTRKRVAPPFQGHGFYLGKDEGKDEGNSSRLPDEEIPTVLLQMHKDITRRNAIDFLHNIDTYVAQLPRKEKPQRLAYLLQLNKGDAASRPFQIWAESCAAGGNLDAEAWLEKVEPKNRNYNSDEVPEEERTRPSTPVAEEQSIEGKIEVLSLLDTAGGTLPAWRN